MRRKEWAATVCLLLAGVCMIALGIVRDEPHAVMEKAIMICLECIGIG